MSIHISDRYSPLKVLKGYMLACIISTICTDSLRVLRVYSSYSHSAPYPCFAAAMIQYPRSNQ